MPNIKQTAITQAVYDWLDYLKSDSPRLADEILQEGHLRILQDKLSDRLETKPFEVPTRECIHTLANPINLINAGKIIETSTLIESLDFIPERLPSLPIAFAFWFEMGYRYATGDKQ